MPSKSKQEIVPQEDGVGQMLSMAERLRAQNGGVLDEAAIQAVAEATNTPLEYVRLALRLRAENTKTSFLSRMRAEYLALDPFQRNVVFAGSMGALIGILHSLQVKTAAVNYGLPGILALLLLLVGVSGIAMAKDAKTGIVSGASMGVAYFLLLSLSAIILQPAFVIYPAIIIPLVLGGAAAGFCLHWIGARLRPALGMKDATAERQELLRQLVSLQDKLRSGEQRITFLSVDIVGSTRMKALADPLSVEFTFTEYHAFVESIARRYGGRVHSTAGDGVILAFDTPQQAFGAARNVQTGMFELNTFRNKIGAPIVVRQGIHSGQVVTPQAGDITSVNFAHVIDMAAHIQKVCPPGAVAVSDAAAVYLPGGPGAVGSERFAVDGCEGTLWIPRPIAATTATPAAPPMPAEG